MAAIFKPAANFVSGCSVHCGYVRLCDRTGDGCTGNAVYTDRQRIMLVLIQIGGLGVIACTSAFFLLLRKKISFRGRQMISQSYGLDTMSGMVKFIIRVLKGTFTVEAIGAVFYSIRFVQDYGVVKGVGYGIFHSVSAFCNAGVDLLGSNSLIGYAGSPLINFTTILLIVVSGLGFPVWYDILGNIKKAVRERGTRPLKWLFTRLELQSKVVLVMTGSLILFGTVLFFYWNIPTRQPWENFQLRRS